jgi:hypothetical protein
MNDNDTLDELVDLISTQDFANAQPVFAELMATKLHDALNAEKVKVAGQMFDPEEDDFDEDLADEDDFDDEDLDEE